MYSHLAALRLAIAGGALFLSLTPAMQGAVVTMDLVCVLENTGICVPGPSFGTVTITDTAANTVRVDVNLSHPSLQFSNMMFQLAGIVGAVLNLADPFTNPLALGSYAIAPNPATFNLGSPNSPPGATNGWNGTSGYLTVIQAAGLSTASFIKDSGGAGQYHVALQIVGIGPDGCVGAGDGTTTCVPGQTGNSTLSVGGFAPDMSDTVPEPLTFAAVGAGLVVLSLVRRGGR
ncbi:MAG: hypothetical protein JNK48_25105 [Bryobacterales bacterium]|nr:hypothetical protein [Bryobacterales bacterium]